MGLYPEGIGYGERAQKIAESYPSDQYLFFKSLGGLCYIYNGQGKIKNIFDGAKRLLDYGEKTANNRSTVFGHWMNGWGHHLAGDLESAQKSFKKAVDVALDPAYAQFPKCTLCLVYCLSGQFQEAENVAQSIFDFSKKRDIGQLTGFAYLSKAFSLIVKGQMNEGFRMFQETQQVFIKNDKKTWYAISELTLGGIYSQMASETSSAFKKAEEHLNKSIEVSREIGATGTLGRAYLSMGLLQKGMEKTDQAKEFLSNAIDIFEELNMEFFMKQAKEALASIE